MAEILMAGGGGGGVSSDDVTATLANVLSGTTALTSDSNDEVGNGTLPLSAVLATNGGSISSKAAETTTLNATTSSKSIEAGQYLSGIQTINVNVYSGLS